MSLAVILAIEPVDTGVRIHHNHFSDQFGVHFEVHFRGWLLTRERDWVSYPIAHGDVHRKFTHLEEERAVRVGAGAGRGAFLKDGGADQRVVGAGVVPCR